MDKKRIVLFGFGVKCLGRLRQLIDAYHVVCIIDNDPGKQGLSIKGIPTGGVDFLQKCNYDEIWIMPTYHKYDMIRDCLKIGIPSEKIRCFFGEATEHELGWIFTYTMDGVIARKGIFVFKLKNATDFAVFQEIFVDHMYNTGISQADTICVDIGMNIGMATLYFASLDNVARVYGFEPFSKTYEQAKENVELSDTMLKKKVEFFNYGIGNKETEVLVGYDSDMTGGNSVLNNNHNFLPQEKVQIKEAATVIRDILDKHPGQNILLKVDCEGSEFAIIENLKEKNVLSSINIILMETHEHGKFRQQDVLKCLYEAEFVYFASQSTDGIGMVYAVKL